MILCLFIIASGWRPQYTGIIHWYIAYTLQWSATTIDGGEQINTVLTFLLIPITLLDRRKNHFYKTVENCNNFYSKYITWLFMILIKIQVGIIYLNAALERLKNPEWADGTALYYFFSDPIFGLPPYQLNVLEPLLNSPFIILVTWAVTVFELFLVICMFASSPLKRFGHNLGIIFHIGIIFTIGIVTFGITMCAAVILYLRQWNNEYSFTKVKKTLKKYINLKNTKRFFVDSSVKNKKGLKKMSGIILFDGDCNFCDCAVQFIIKNDKKGYFKFASLQSEIGICLLNKYSAPHDIDSIFLLENNKYHYKSSAVLRICKNLKGWYKTGYILIIIPKPLRDFIYNIVAKNRYRWFGKRETCMIPSPEVRKRFLD